MNDATLQTWLDPRGVLTIRLNRPHVRNALDEAIIGALLTTCEETAAREDVLVVVLRGSGPAFCAGADIAWMERLSNASMDENRADARRFAAMLGALNALPQPIVGVVHGAAIGGAIGLVAACDAVLASAETTFRFSEARLGLIPATVAPLVIAKIGVTQARYFFTTARAFDAARAQALGLVHEVVPAQEDLDARLACILDDLLAGGPQALMAAKRLAREAPGAERLPEMAELLAQIRATPEAREGFAAFRAKRAPVWMGGQG